MTQVNVGKDKLVKVMVGNKVVWERPDYENIWFNCKTSLYGQALMQFNEVESIGKIMLLGNQLLLQPGESLNNEVVFQLPKGFRFGPNDPAKLSFTNIYMASRSIIFSDNSLIISVRNSSSSSSQEVRLKPYTSVIANVTIMSFNVVKK